MTLRQVAQYADMSNFGPHVYTGGAASLADVERKCAALRRHCDTFERHDEAVLRSHIVFPLILARTRETLATKMHAMMLSPGASAEAGMFVGTPQELVTYYQSLAETGMQYFIAAIRTDDRETLELLGGDVLPALSLEPEGLPAGGVTD